MPRMVTSARPPRHPVATRMEALTAMAPGEDWAMAGQIQHFLLLDPVQIVHEFFLHQGNDDETAAEGEGAQIKGGGEELPIGGCGCFHKSLSIRRAGGAM